MSQPEVIEAKSIEDVPKYFEWFIPIWRIGSGSPWFPCCEMFRTAVEAEGELSRFAPGAVERKIVRIVLPN